MPAMSNVLTRSVSERHTSKQSIRLSLNGYQEEMERCQNGFVNDTIAGELCKAYPGRCRSVNASSSSEARFIPDFLEEHGVRRGSSSLSARSLNSAQFNAVSSGIGKYSARLRALSLDGMSYNAGQKSASMNGSFRAKEASNAGREEQKQEKTKGKEVDSPLLEATMNAPGTGLYIRVKCADMTPSMQRHALRCAKAAFDASRCLSYKESALVLKKEFDQSHGLVWHCIVGTSFGSFVTYSMGGFIYFSINKVAVLLFKTTVEPLTCLEPT